MSADYVLGAYEARGNVSIARHGGNRLLGRIAIETRVPSPVLEKVFGNPPQHLRAYVINTYRYATAEPERVQVLVAMLLGAGVASPARAELEILRDFCLASDDAGRVKCMDALRGLRAKGARR